MDYCELSVVLLPRDPWTEVLIAQLAENGYESFVETDSGLRAYGPVNDIDIQHPVKNTFLTQSGLEVQAKWSISILEKQNWNTEWESQFEPVFIEDDMTILAPFHDRSIARGMIVEIMPKMSFGTGHHQTTWMMAKALFELNQMPEKVLDMGTGTGVLAIIAEKLGAKEILAVDIEDWSVENAIENSQRNNCQFITVLCGDVDQVRSTEFDLILANINKNVLKAHMPHYASKLKKGGNLFLSGFFISDVDEILSISGHFGFEKKCILNRDNWATIKLQLM